jgi:hypothetical protein
MGAIQDIFTRFAPEYINRYQDRMPANHIKAVWYFDFNLSNGQLRRHDPLRSLAADCFPILSKFSKNDTNDHRNTCF